MWNSYFRQKNSIDDYISICEKARVNAATERDIFLMYNTIYKELILYSYSPLLDASYTILKRHVANAGGSFYEYDGRGFNVTKNVNSLPFRNVVSVFDAYIIIIQTKKYIYREELGGDVTTFLGSIGKTRSNININGSRIYKCLDKIDEAVVSQRVEMCNIAMKTDANEKKKDSGEGYEESTHQPEKGVDEVKILEEKLRGLNEEIKNRKEVLLQLTVEAEAKRETLDRLNDSIEEKKKEYRRDKINAAEEENNRMRDELLGIRRNLSEVSEALIKMESNIEEKNVSKIFTYLSELYFLIADTKESTEEIAKSSNNEDLLNASYNLDVFMFMITDCFADFGIETINTPVGQHFDGRYHEVTGDRNFDPREAVVLCSVRSGFKFGERILVKEKIKVRMSDR